MLYKIYEKRYECMANSGLKIGKEEFGDLILKE